MIKFKDLYVTLAPEKGKVPEPNIYLLRRPQGTVPPSTPCCDPPFWSMAPHDPVFFQAPADPAPVTKDTLIAYLTAELDRPDVAIEHIQVPGDLQTVADIDALEVKLDEAIGELELRKAQLQKMPTVTK
jgi:hypothetical protein